MWVKKRDKIDVEVSLKNHHLDYQKQDSQINSLFHREYLHTWVPKWKIMEAPHKFIKILQS